MRLIDYILLAVIAVLLFIAIRRTLQNRKKGCCGCCSCCSCSEECKNKKE